MLDSIFHMILRLLWNLISGVKDTVKPAVAATSIKRDPPISGHFNAPERFLIQMHLY